MKIRLFVLMIAVTVVFVFRSIASAPSPMFIPAYLLIGLGLLSLSIGVVAYLR